MTLSEELAWRGFVNQTTYKNIKAVDKIPISFYWGVDPSADSMTVGNLATAMMVRHFVEHGHKAVLLVGGATGLIGDPDGKTEERELKSPEEISENRRKITEQYKTVFAGQDFEIVDNFDWFKNIGYLEFLRDVGKRVPMRAMLGRQFVQTRLSEAGAGISYAEFSYVLVQAYDFLHLYKEHGVTLQVCGADQWGNCIAGVDLIRRVTGKEANVWSAPLIINKATGQKFGKTESGAVWLNPDKTSPYRFYQFWLNTDDESVEGFLKIYTLLSKENVDQTMKEFNDNRGQRLAQKTLAFEVTKLVHGEEQANAVRHISEVLFGAANFLELDASEVEVLRRELPTGKPGPNLAITLASTGLASSASEARRLISAGAVSLNSVKVSTADVNFLAGANLIKCGKNKFAIIEVVQS